MLTIPKEGVSQVQETCQYSSGISNSTVLSLDSLFVGAPNPITRSGISNSTLLLLDCLFCGLT